ncbi:MAG TPA: cation diffusion facilitator family transporter [Acidimicrobiales bacterium]|nr:cation diffusion facilitator family transporter [Acidimicrobiales bacterium]
MAGGGHGTRAVVAALLANLGIALAKFVGYLLTQSASMLAESVHSVADSGNQALLLLGGHKAKRAPTEDHPFGYGRERYFWSFVVALILFSVGGMFALYEGVAKVRHPHELESVPIAIGILVFAILLESLSFRTAVVEANRTKDPRLGWWSFIRRSKSPELPVVLLEDLGALIGLVLALIAVSIAHVTDEPVWDGIGTMCIGALLIVIAAVLAAEMKGLLIGESASEADRAKIAATIAAEPGVVRLIHVRTQHIGPEELLVGAKIELTSGLSVAEAAAVVDRVETSVRRAVPAARIMYLEPDVFRTAVPDDVGAVTAPDEPASVSGQAEPS